MDIKDYRVEQNRFKLISIFPEKITLYRNNELQNIMLKFKFCDCTSLDLDVNIEMEQDLIKHKDFITSIPVREYAEQSIDKIEAGKRYEECDVLIAAKRKLLNDFKQEVDEETIIVSNFNGISIVYNNNKSIGLVENVNLNSEHNTASFRNEKLIIPINTIENDIEIYIKNDETKCIKLTIDKNKNIKNLCYNSNLKIIEELEDLSNNNEEHIEDYMKNIRKVKKQVNVQGMDFLF